MTTIPPQETLIIWSQAISHNSNVAKELLNSLNQKTNKLRSDILIKHINIHEANVAKYQQMRNAHVFKARKIHEIIYEMRIDSTIREYITTVTALTSKKETIQPSKSALDNLKSLSSNQESIIAEFSKINIATNPSVSTSPNPLSNSSSSPLPNHDLNQELTPSQKTEYYDNTQNSEMASSITSSIFSNITTLESPPSSPYGHKKEEINAHGQQNDRPKGQEAFDNEIVEDYVLPQAPIHQDLVEDEWVDGWIKVNEIKFHIAN